MTRRAQPPALFLHPHVGKPPSARVSLPLLRALLLIGSCHHRRMFISSHRHRIIHNLVGTVPRVRDTRQILLFVHERPIRVGIAKCRRQQPINRLRIFVLFRFVPCVFQRHNPGFLRIVGTLSKAWQHHQCQYNANSHSLHKNGSFATCTVMIKKQESYVIYRRIANRHYTSENNAPALYPQRCIASPKPQRVQ